MTIYTTSQLARELGLSGPQIQYLILKIGARPVLQCGSKGARVFDAPTLDRLRQAAADTYAARVSPLGRPQCAVL